MRSRQVDARREPGRPRGDAVGRARPVAAVCSSLCAAAGGGKLSGGVVQSRPPSILPAEPRRIARAAKLGHGAALDSVGTGLEVTVEEHAVEVVAAAEPVELDQAVGQGGADP